MKINTDIVQFVVTAAAAAGNLNGNMYEVRKMRELRQPTLLRVFFLCIYRCPVCLCSLELATRSVPLPLFGEKVRLQVIPRVPKLVRFYSEISKSITIC